MDTIRIFVGCAANNDDLESQSVLEWSIRKHASMPVEITWMQLNRNPTSPFYSDGNKGWQTQQWATPFSGFRWAVPSLCGYQGKAIYVDSDFIVLRDIAQLWKQQHNDGKIIIAGANFGGAGVSWRICMSLWHCERAKPFVAPYKTLMADPTQHNRMIVWLRQHHGMVQPFDGDWNNLDGKNGVDLAQVCAVHLTDMHTQCQLKHALPRLQKERRRHWFDGAIRPHPRKDIQALFDRLLVEAIKEGYGPEKYRVPLFGDLKKRSFAGRV